MNRPTPKMQWLVLFDLSAAWAPTSAQSSANDRAWNQLKFDLGCISISAEDAPTCIHLFVLLMYNVNLIAFTYTEIKR